MSSPNGLSDRVLVIGDEVKSARATERLLTAAGYAAELIGSLELAREQVRNDAASLVIIELSAYRLTGGSIIGPAETESAESQERLKWASDALAFCSQIRSADAATELPVLIISKSQRPQDRIACLNAGATDFITKPYQRAELLSRVRAHLRTWHYERERTERFEQLNVLHAVSSVLASSLEPEVLLSGTLSVLIKKMRADAGVVFLKNSSSQAISIVAAEGLDLSEDNKCGVLDLYSRIVPLMNGKPLVLEPFPDSARLGLACDTLAGVRGLLCAPLGVKGQALGAICLVSHTSVPFPKPYAELLSTICNQLSVALDNARLYVETRRSASQLSFVYNLGNNLMTSLEMDELLGYAVFTVGKSLECDVCAVVVRSSGENEDLISAFYSKSHDQNAGENEWFIPERVKRYLDTADGSLRPSIETRVAERFLRDPKISIETIVPLVFDDSLLGILLTGMHAARRFSDDDQRLLGAVAQQLSLAIRNTELYQRTKDTSINLALEVSKRTKEIEEQKRFTEKIIDSLPVSLYVVDRDMHIVAWNRNREVGGRGLTREEVLGRNVFNVLARQPRRMLEEEFVEVFRTGEIVRMEQESWVDGQQKIWTISKIPMRVDNAEVSHVITVGEDVTEQKKMNEAVIHAEKLASIGRLAAGVVHELNNPLATIAACAEALATRVEDPQQGAIDNDFGEYLRIIKDEAFRCKTITNSLLDFSHQRQAEKISSDINQLIEQTLQLVRHHPKLGKLRIVMELDHSLIPAYVNEGQMKQVFIALISNAYDAMDGIGTLTVRTRWHDSGDEPRICAEIADTGCGIPAGHLQKIFDPFFTTKPLGSGTGLGLSVCYGIVSEHGGRIEVDTVEGKGATFRILLPVSPEVAQRQAQHTLREQELESAL
ncbi:MAG TPA: ATP-binding protein [Blastocatellia bacterium]|nr:ATP-binding protein [Blastocatellia bacterium]